MQRTWDLNIAKTEPLITPRDLLGELPMSPAANETVVNSREQVKRILAREDPRFLVAVGPCSIHDPKAAREYAGRLRKLAREVQDRLFVVMRVYFEKPRTTVGWKGLINDPHLNDTFAMAEGLRLARRLLLDIAEMGLPAVSELLEPITPQYIADLVTVAAIGARTTESPTHRQMSSGLSMPVGFKNSTDGNLQVALDAMQSARHAHCFLGIDENGSTCVMHTRGNQWGFLILRGGRSGANYSAAHLAQATEQVQKAGVSAGFMVDCSHANSEKDYRKQANVWREVVRQRVVGMPWLIGAMLESNLSPGSQRLSGEPSALQYGVSVTDGCIGWEETESLIREAYEQFAADRPAVAAGN